MVLSNLSDRSDEENKRNLSRFTPLMYQMKGSTGASGQTRSKNRDIIGQEPGCYPYPSGDKRESPSVTEDETGTKETQINWDSESCCWVTKLL